MIALAKRAIDHSVDTLHQRRRTALKGLGLSACLLAASAAHPEDLLHWQDVWVRAMPPGAQVTAAYGKLMNHGNCLLYTSPSPRDVEESRMPSSA